MTWEQSHLSSDGAGFGRNLWKTGGGRVPNWKDRAWPSASRTEGRGPESLWGVVSPYLGGGAWLSSARGISESARAGVRGHGGVGCGGKRCLKRVSKGSREIARIRLTRKEGGGAGHGSLRKGYEGHVGGRDPFGSGARCTRAKAGGRGSVRGVAREDEGVWRGPRRAVGACAGCLALGANWGMHSGGSLERRDPGRIGGLNGCTWGHGVILYSLNTEYPVPGTVLEAKATARTSQRKSLLREKTDSIQVISNNDKAVLSGFDILYEVK